MSAVVRQQRYLSTAGADGRCEEPSGTTWPSSDLTARPCLASAASERHFSPGPPEETPLHTMLFLPAAALCCLCSALVAMAAELIQDDLTLTRRVGGNVSFSCRGTNQCGGNYVFWYQKRDTETFTLILDIHKTNGGIDSRYNHPQKDDFSAVNKQNGCELEIQKVKLSHSASYYCSCGIALHRLIFGSGTKLHVTDEPVVKPVVSVYPAASRAHLEGKSSLLCLASAMFPPLVQFSWKRRKDNGPLEELPPAEGEQLELREPGRTAAILLIRQPENTYKYRCYVHHEGGTVEAPAEQEVPAPAASCPPEREPAHLPALQQADLSFQSQCKVKLLCVLYTVLIVKSLVYCCGLSLLMILRNKGLSTNCTHAD
ncbi:immunoglobulin lambda-1 light chain-like [Sebastes fasciatus]|uniref:immunoglobulin lambda-1 light chain-like n=1 Tax=Sebastes fasciatus TaxID=394691 RepID=UPI003D9FA30D